MSLKSELQEILAKNIHPALLEVLTPSEVLVIFKELAVATDQTLYLLYRSLPKDLDATPMLLPNGVDTNDHRYAQGYNQALADVRKVIKEEL